MAASAAGKQRIDELERRVAALERRLQDAPPSAPALAWQPIADPAAPLAAPMPPPSPSPPSSSSPSPAAKPPRRSLDSVLGANWLARAGMLLLALGVVFFLRLAYDRGWVPIEARYAIGLLGGLGLWAAGDLLRGRRIDPAFTQVLSGGGAVIAYVTLYLGYALPHYRDALGMSLPLVLVLLAAASILLAAYAVWRDLPILGGVAAGLATVLLAPAGDFSTAGVLYATFLDTGILLAAAWRRWDAVAVTALVAANLPILAGFVEDVPWQLLLACAVVANGAGLVASATPRTGPRAVVCIEGGLAVALLAISTAAALNAAGLADPLGWTLLAIGAIALALAFALRRPGPGIAAVAVALLILWPLAHFPGELWAPLALGLLCGAAAALQALMPRVRPWGDVAALVAGLVGLMAFLGATEGGSADVHRVLAAAAGLALAGAAMGHWATARRDRRQLAAGSLAVGLLALVLMLATLLTSWMVTVSWALVAVAAVAIGLAARLDDLRLAAFGVFGLVLLRIFTVDLAGLGVVARVVAFLLTGTLLLVAAFLYARARRNAPG